MEGGKRSDDAGRLALVGEALYGKRWQTELARALGFKDGRRVRQWLSGARSVPAGVWFELEVLLDGKIGEVNAAKQALRASD